MEEDLWNSIAAAKSAKSNIPQVISVPRPKRSKTAPSCGNDPSEKPVRLRLRSAGLGKRKDGRSCNISAEDVSHAVESEKLEQRLTKDKGRGIFSKCMLQRNSIVCQYKGKLLTKKEGLKQEASYSAEKVEGCFLLFFSFHGKELCIDATKEDETFGRLLNHSRKRPNLVPQAAMIDGVPGVAFKAKHDIKEGEELLYDYAETRKEVLKFNPWLKNS